MPPPRLFVTSFSLAVLIIATGCSQSLPRKAPAPAGTYRIYSSFPRSGPAAALSLEIVRAIDLAVNEYGAAGKTPSVEHVQLTVPEDEAPGGSARGEVLNAEQAVNDPGAIAYIGPYASGDASASLPITNKGGLLQVGLSQTWPGLTQRGWSSDEPAKYLPSEVRNYVRLSTPDNVQAEAAAMWAADLGASRVLVVSDGSGYSDGMRVSFEKAAIARGLTVAGTMGYSSQGFSGIRADVTRLSADSVFYAPSTTQQAVAVARAVEPVNLAVGIFATDTALNDQFAGSVADVSGAWHIVFNGAAQLPSTIESAAFSKAFASSYGRQPGRYAAYAYDASRIILGALERGRSSDRASLLRVVLATRDYAGAGGTVSFDGGGDPVGWSVGGYRLKDGAFVLDRTLTSKP